VTEGQSAITAAGVLDKLPARDRASYLMSQRLGQTEGNFQPGGLFRGDGVQGSVDEGKIAEANNNYRPGMGNTSTQDSVLRAYLKKLGYLT
jgi:hypothetical protein